MRQYLPGRDEIALFAVLAVICASVVSVMGTVDFTAMLAFPVFVFAAVFGLWKHGRLRA